MSVSKLAPWSLGSLVLAACGQMYQSSGDPPASSPPPSPTEQGGPGFTPPPPSTAPSPGPASAPAASGLPRDAQAMLDSHNAYRARHCAAPLAWSAELATTAEAWARSLVQQGCKFEHSTTRYGENLAAGTAGTVPPSTVVAMWYDEVAKYRFPDGGFSMETGHFTQVAWRATSKLGCGVAQCNNMDIWVCHYDPPGNVQGQYAAQVLAPGCR